MMHSRVPPPLRQAVLVGYLTGLGAALLYPTSLRAQSPDRADSLLGVGDTAAAVQSLRDLLSEDRRNAELHHRLGLILWERARDDGAVSEDRRAAEEHLRYATRYEPDSAKYWLTLAGVFRTAEIVTMRVQWGKTLRRAREEAVAHTSPLLAEIEFELGRMAWEAWERTGRRAAFGPGEAVTLPSGSDGDDWRDLVNLLETRIRTIEGVGETTREEAIDHLRASVTADPTFTKSVQLLVVALGSTGNWQEARRITTRLTRLSPQDWRAWMTHGLVLTRLGDYASADSSQARALELAPEQQRRYYQDLSRLLPRQQADQLQRAAGPSRERFRDFYWTLAKPLYLRDENEYRVEYLARVTESEIRWSDPEMGRRGTETKQGEVFVRWGPPPLWRTFSNNTILWVYPEQRMFFQFRGRPGYTYRNFAGESEFSFQARTNSSPATFLNVEPARTIDSAIMQVAQFRHEARDSLDLAVFSFVPLGRMAREVRTREVLLESGLFVKDRSLSDLHRSIDTETVTTGDTNQVELRSWRAVIPRTGAEMLVRVEAQSTELGRAARSAKAIRVRDFPENELSVSDVIVAERLAPRDSQPSSWRDFFIQPSAGQLEPNSSIGLLWEIYNLQADNDGVGRYQVLVSIRVQSIIRRRFGARILGGLADAMGLSAKGDEIISISYDAEELLASEGVKAEYLTLALEDAPEGDYQLVITVTDRETGTEASTSRRFRVDTQEPGG